MRKIVILDIDGTLLDLKYKNNSTALIKTIKKCKSEGVIFSLNSNRSLHDLLPVYKKFGLNGFIIGENGAFVIYPNKTAKKYASESQMRKLRKVLPRVLTKKIPGSEFRFEDTVEILNKPSNLASSTLLLANKFRVYTTSIFVRRKIGKRLLFDLKLNSKVANQVRYLIKTLKLDYKIKSSDLFCNVLILPKICDKASTLLKVRNSKYRNYELIMISDEEEKSLINAVDAFYAVANAQRSVKADSDYVSKAKYAQGVDEILKKKVLTA